MTLNTPNTSTAPQAAGFNFDHVHRNAMLESLAASSSTNSNGAKLSSATKTGTTIVGMTFAGGVVLGADTRATGGTEVAEKNCEKIHYLAPNMYCCGAGTAADTEQTTALISSQLELLRMDTGADSRVITACTLLKRMLFKYQGHVSAALVLGGCDLNGPHVYQIYPHGSTGKLPFTTMGSGSLAAMSVFESTWKEGMQEDEAVNLVQRAIGAGIFNDLGSGSNVDVCIIRMDGTVDYRRNNVKPNEIAPLRAAIQHSSRFRMPVGVTPILSESFCPHPVVAAAVSLADVTVTEMEVESS